MQRRGVDDLKEVERTAAKIRVVRRLVLFGPLDYMTAVLHGVAASATVEDLEVWSKLYLKGHVWLLWVQHYCIVCHKLVTCSLPHL